MGLAASKGCARSRSPYSPPHSSPSGRTRRPRLADSFPPPGSGARGIPRVARPSDPERREWPLLEYAKESAGALGTSVRPPRGEGNCGVPTGASVRPSRGREGSKGVGGSGRWEGSQFRVCGYACLSRGARGLRTCASAVCVAPAPRSTSSPALLPRGSEPKSTPVTSAHRSVRKVAPPIYRA